VLDSSRKVKQNEEDYNIITGRGVYVPSSSSLMSLAACIPSSLSDLSIALFLSSAARSSALRLQPMMAICPLTHSARVSIIMHREMRSLNQDDAPDIGRRAKRNVMRHNSRVILRSNEASTGCDIVTSLISLCCAEHRSRFVNQLER